MTRPFSAEADDSNWPYATGSIDMGPIKDPQGTDLAKLSESLSAKQVQVKGDHYKKYPIQPYEYNQQNGLRYCEGNVVKYVTRHRDKGGRDDILKAIHYLNLLLEEEYANE